MLNSYAGTGLIVSDAWKKGILVPGFKIPYLPMMEPEVRALRDTAGFVHLQA